MLYCEGDEEEIKYRFSTVLMVLFEKTTFCFEIIFDLCKLYVSYFG